MRLRDYFYMSVLWMYATLPTRYRRLRHVDYCSKAMTGNE